MWYEGRGGREEERERVGAMNPYHNACFNFNKICAGVRTFQAFCLFPLDWFRSRREARLQLLAL